MSFCEKCGAKLNEGAFFCPNCGHRVNVKDFSAQEKNGAVSEPSAAAEGGARKNEEQADVIRACGGTGAEGGARPDCEPPNRDFLPRAAMPCVTGILKDILSSPVVLIAAISLSLASVCNFIGNLTEPHAVLSSDINGYYFSGAYNGAFSGYAILAFILTALLSAGVWMVYAGAKDRARRGIGTAGLKFIKVMLIIDLVFECVLIGLVLIVCAALLLNANLIIYSLSSGDALDAGILRLASVGVMFAVIIYGVIVILVYALSLSSVNVVKKAEETGRWEGKVSMFVAVVAFIMGACAIGAVFSAYGVFSVLGCIFTAAEYICFGIIIVRIRKKIKDALPGYR